MTVGSAWPWSFVEPINKMLLDISQILISEFLPIVGLLELEFNAFPS